eukprot:CAMPEP_0115172274 /NCGR_PEP_ID=MMETSP0270-20121206/2730_1 /TAXON_ID=71861 /ORGANISM="Scrippsiella trochoidea, Strain CCMP3099" /LENGTH=87 /DNA_ID=CAMNT_0002585059 /DNA_START=189 /DNA_END=452 /DNA_ORIENTATION=-
MTMPTERCARQEYHPIRRTGTTNIKGSVKHQWKIVEVWSYSMGRHATPSRGPTSAGKAGMRGKAAKQAAKMCTATICMQATPSEGAW